MRTNVNGLITRTLSRRTFAATVTGKGTQRDDHGPIAGPVIVTVEVTQARRRDGVECWPTYSVIVDGCYVSGGCADHLPADGIPAGSWLTIGSELEAEQVAHLDELDAIAAAAGSYAGARILEARDRIRARIGDRTVNAGDLLVTNAGTGEVWVGVATGDLNAVDTDDETAFVDGVVVFDELGEVLRRYAGSEFATRRRIADAGDRSYFAGRYVDVLEQEADSLRAERQRLDTILERHLELVAAGRRAERCTHVGEPTIERTAHGFLGDRPAGTVELLCAACGGVLEQRAPQPA